MAAEDLLLVAGEASGDLHGARLLRELGSLIPRIKPFGVGGDEMLAAGLQPLAHSREVSVVGITEALKVLPRARRLFAEILDQVDRARPSTAVLIDFPDFNLRLAGKLKERGVKVVYYISPQVWAWRTGRVKTIARVVDRMLVLLPFEVEFYRRHGVEVVHVGHPLVDEIPEIPNVWDRGGPADGPFQIALLPGSRLSELEALLPEMLQGAQRLAQRLPVSLVLIQAPTVPGQALREHLRSCKIPVRLITSDRFRAVADSHLALCASGTATLEVGLLGTPMLVLYRVTAWTYLVAQMLVRLPFVALANLVLERKVVPELLQSLAKPERIAHEAAEILTTPDRVAAMRSALGELRGRLGEGGASRRAAAEVARVMRQETAAPGR